MVKYISVEDYCKNSCRCAGLEDGCKKESCPIWNAPAAKVAPIEWFRSEKQWYWLPLRIGDTGYLIRNYRGNNRGVVQGVVSEMHFTADMDIQIHLHGLGSGKYDETIFKTYHDAAERLRSMKR